MARILVLLALICLTSVQAVVRFDGHRVLRLTPQTPDEFRTVSNLQKTAEKRRVDIWKYSNGVGKSFQFRVPPEDYESTISTLKILNLHYDVTIKDLQIAVENQRNASSGNTLNAIDFDYGRYHDFDEVNQWIDDMAAEYPNMVKVFNSSRTYEGRDIRGLRITTNATAGKVGLWYQGGIHGREWITPATVMYITGKLMEQYSVRDDVKQVVDGFDIFVVPVINADGYVYTWTTDRMWRKTRTRHAVCRGADPNRNYDYQWGPSSGSRGDPCSDTYRGPRAFSEPSIEGVTNFIKSSGVTFKGFVDFHSFSEVWMTPWGYTQAEPTDFTEQDDSSAAATAAIEAVHGTQYRHGTIADVLYIANGVAVDWAYGSMGIKYAATPELRDKGQYGFVLPADQIIPCGEETLEGFLAYARYVLEH